MSFFLLAGSFWEETRSFLQQAYLEESGQNQSRCLEEKDVSTKSTKK